MAFKAGMGFGGGDGLKAVLGLLALAVLAWGVYGALNPPVTMVPETKAHDDSESVFDGSLTERAPSGMVGTRVTETPIITKTPARTPTRTVTPGEPAAGETQVRPADGMVLVYVPPGKFLMGAKDERAYDNEKPQHEVYLSAYWIDKFEVTNGQYARCVEDGACGKPKMAGSHERKSYYGDSAYADYPVIYVDWNMAATYCAWAGRRLPSEAEWEKAARGSDGSQTYPWGGRISCEIANYGECKGDTTKVGSHPVGASPYGVMDMAGNVWEWVADWYDEAYYGSSPLVNPTGPADGIYRVLRGGSWFNQASSASSTNRNAYGQIIWLSDIGFRCAWDER